MRAILATLAPALVAAVTAAPATARDIALLLANARYDNAPAVSGATDILDTRHALERAGFQVISGEALSLDDALRRVAAAAEEMADADRVVVMLAGQVVHSPRDSWWLAKEAEAPTGYDVGRQGVSLGALMDLAVQSRGPAVVMVANAYDAIAPGAGLAAGAAMSDLPQGVTYVTGPAERLAGLVSSELLRPGTTLREAFSTPYRGVSVSGYLPGSSLAATTEPKETDGDDGAAEAGFWAAVTALDTVDAYLSYVDAYPDGAHLREANQRIAAIRQAPERQAEAAERALGLDRVQRQTIQRNLTILGYDTRGIDGIFGPGTRAAITKWQTATGQPATGFLERGQVVQLQAAAAQRARELEAEAARRQAEQERQDRAFWNDVANDGGAAGLRAYLDRYPEGLFADEARARLDRIEADNRDTVQTQERLIWDNVTAEDTVEAYQTYLDRYPDGAFAERARIRIDELARADQRRIEQEAARREEERVAGGGLTRLLAEQRLAQLGLDPGNVDGNFDADARAAIRRYQETRGLTVTGYLDEATVVRMLAGQ